MKATITTTLNNGRTVLAKVFEGDVVAKTYANRTQALKALELVGEGWTIFRGEWGRPFYVVKIEEK
jgi:hypothetical protein